METARAHVDEGLFILGLVALTSFHGITMMPFWRQWMSELGRQIGDSGQLLWSFSIGMMVAIVLPFTLFAALVWVTRRFNDNRVEYRRLFSGLAMAALPLAFAYHLAHNLNHLARESRGFGAVLSNPLGNGSLPLSSNELHLRQIYPLLPQELIFSLQALLIVFGFWMGLRILRRRSETLLAAGPAGQGLRQAPITLFLLLVSLFNLWLLMQPMTMRM